MDLHLVDQSELFDIGLSQAQSLWGQSCFNGGLSMKSIFHLQTALSMAILWLGYD